MPFLLGLRLERVALACLLALALWTSGDAVAADRLITLDAEDAYLPSVLKILAEKGDLNIITGPGVSGGRISIHMRDVPVDEAVNLVVRAAGLAYEKIGRSILVADPKSLQEETGLSSHIVDLQYANANEVKEAIKDLAAEVQVDQSGNRLIVVTSPRVISEIREVVERLDVPARQVMLEARIIEVSTDDAMKLGVDWNTLNRQGFVIVEGTPSPAAPGDLPEELPFGPMKFNADNFTRQSKAFQVALDLLVREGNARVLANPKIATLNGKPASMLIGTRIPYLVSGTTFAGGAAAPTQRIEREEVGIKLHITPLINADGYITTDIAPEVSSVIGFRGPNNDIPVVATREATTTVRLKDGNSVIIGGLLSEEKSTVITKVPILGSIPGLGILFQNHSVQSSKKDLVIEVTPRLLPDQQ